MKAFNQWGMHFIAMIFKDIFYLEYNTEYVLIIYFRLSKENTKEHGTIQFVRT